tara:strand:+ start:777 stop:938 length:162 start_codon:yes stop_codon:yes gene_type:complete
MFSSNWYGVFTKKNKVQPQQIVNIKVWENKKKIHEVEVKFDNLQKKSNSHKEK